MAVWRRTLCARKAAVTVGDTDRLARVVTRARLNVWRAGADPGIRAACVDDQGERLVSAARRDLTMNVEDCISNTSTSNDQACLPERRR